MPFLSSYAVSKAGIVRFVETLAGELCDYNVDVNAIAPGALNTRLLDEIIEAGPDKVGKDFYERSLKQKINRRFFSGNWSPIGGIPWVRY